MEWKLLELVKKYLMHFFCWRKYSMPTDLKLVVVVTTVLFGVAVNAGVPLIIELFFRYVQFDVVREFSKYIIPFVYFVVNAVFFRFVFHYLCE